MVLWLILTKEEILARALNNNCPYIYLGANMSFNPPDKDWEGWDKLINGLLEDGIWVTLDFDVSLLEQVF